MHARTCLGPQIKRRILNAQLAEQERVSVKIQQKGITKICIYRISHWNLYAHENTMNYHREVHADPVQRPKVCSHVNGKWHKITEFSSFVLVIPMIHLMKYTPPQIVFISHYFFLNFFNVSNDSIGIYVKTLMTARFISKIKIHNNSTSKLACLPP